LFEKENLAEKKRSDKRACSENQSSIIVTEADVRLTFIDGQVVEHLQRLAGERAVR
jgi:hypothetical protein